MALKQLFSMAHQQGIVMAFSDVFLGLTVLFAAVALGTIMMRRPATRTATRGEH
jgi:DHA2 family multidrug resistance protein